MDAKSLFSLQITEDIKNLQAIVAKLAGNGSRIIDFDLRSGQFVQDIPEGIEIFSHIRREVKNLAHVFICFVPRFKCGTG